MTEEPKKNGCCSNFLRNLFRRKDVSEDMMRRGVSHSVNCSKALNLWYSTRLYANWKGVLMLFCGIGSDTLQVEGTSNPVVHKNVDAALPLAS